MATKRSIISTNDPKGFWPFTEAAIIYETVAIAVVAGITFAIGVALHEPWIVVPLAATIVTAAQTPASDEASFANSVLGNLIGMVVAFVLIDALRLEHHSVSALLAEYSQARAFGVISAIILTPLISTIVRVVQPAAAATAAFLVFGGIAPTTFAALSLTLGIIVVAALGDIMRRLRVRAAPI